MQAWAFRDYIDGDRNPIQDWLADKRQVPVKARAKIQRLLMQLAGTPLWVRPWASNLVGYPGIVEIRICYMNVEYRLLGYRGPDARQFTLLYPALEKDSQFVPVNAPEIAVRRMTIVEGDWSRTSEHRFG
jgi:hypothetical protein